MNRATPRSVGRRRLSLAAVASFAVAGLAFAQAAPASRPLRIVSPFAPGGGTDFLARLLSVQLARTLGRNVVVENKAGANGVIGAEAVAHATPDGDTLLLATVGTHGINAAVHEKLPYDTVADFAPVSMVARTPMLLLAHPGVTARDAAGLVAQARQRSEPFVYSSAGVGSVGHMAGELFAKSAGIELTHAPYRGGALAVNDLVAGQVQLMFGTPVSTLQFVKAGRLRLLGATSARRSSVVPEVPTLTEQGFGPFDVNTWYGLLAPARTPPALVAQLQRKVVEFLADASVRGSLLEQGLEAVGNTPAEFDAQIRAEVARWARVAPARR